MRDDMLPLNRNYCQCSGCNKYFNSVAAFEKHRRKGVCLTTEDMTAREMEINKRGYWITRPRIVK
mgnify:CR=1 FL=1